MSTLGWFLIALGAFLFSGGVGTVFGAFLGWFAREKFGAIPYFNVRTEERVYYDPKTMRPGSELGFVEVKEAKGPMGLFGGWITIPEPYVIRNKEGKPIGAFGPYQAFLGDVAGVQRNVKNELTKVQLELVDKKVKLARAEGMNAREVQRQVDVVVKAVQDVSPMNLNAKKRQQSSGRSNYGSF